MKIQNLAQIQQELKITKHSLLALSFVLHQILFNHRWFLDYLSIRGWKIITIQNTQSLVLALPMSYIDQEKIRFYFIDWLSIF